MLPPRALGMRLTCWRRPSLLARQALRPQVHCMSGYRWAPERDGGRRKRESLFDNLEPVQDSAVQQGVPTSNSSSPGRSGRGRRRQAGPPAPESEPVWDVESASTTSAASSSSPAAQAPLAGGSSSSNGAGPRAGEAATGGGGAAGAAGGWDEWSGWEPADAGPMNDYGWAEESWGSSGASPSAVSQQPEQPPPSGSGADWDRAAHHAYGGTRWEAHAEHQAEAPPPPGPEAAGFGDTPYGGSGQQYPGSGPQYPGYSEEYQPGDSAPDISMLSPGEMERVLHVLPFSKQAAYFSRGATATVQRWGASLALTVLLSKFALAAGCALTWPLWWPWALAAQKNYSIAKQFKFVGLWRTQLLDVELTGRPKPAFGALGLGGNSAATTQRLARFLVGDPGGARTEMTLPYDARFELITEGEPAELLVISNSPSFETFRAVKDVYLPGCGLWLSDYPYVDRTAFLEVSLEIEREIEQEAQAQQAVPGAGGGPGSAAAGYPPGRGGYYSGGY